MVAVKRQKSSKKIRKGDKVIAIAGNYTGQTGTVLKRVGDNKAIVQGMNMRKKHVKKSQTNPQGDIISIEKPMQISNLRICSEDNKPVKLKIKADSEGKRYLYYMDGGKEVVYRYIKAQG